MRRVAVRVEDMAVLFLMFDLLCPGRRVGDGFRKSDAGCVF